MQKSKGVSIALALFFGSFGIHWFYLEKPGRGILYALFFWTGLPLLAAVIDIIIFLGTSDADFQEKYSK